MSCHNKRLDRLVEKTEFYTDKKTGQEKRRSPVTRNEHYRQMLRQVKQNQIPFRYVLNDVWFASADSMMFVKHELEREFVMPLKTNCKVALSLEDKKQGRYERVDTLAIEPDTSLTLLSGRGRFPLHLVKQVFTSGRRGGFTARNIRGVSIA